MALLGGMVLHNLKKIEAYCMIYMMRLTLLLQKKTKECLQRNDPTLHIGGKSS